MSDIQEILDTLKNTTAEAVLMGYQIRAPQSHRRGAADLIKMGLWDEKGVPTVLGEQVVKELTDIRKAFSEQDLPPEQYFNPLI